VFAGFGLDLDITEAGCCGMSGLFGHEQARQALSQQIFELGWKRVLGKGEAIPLVSGFSCRCQCREHGHPTLHPAALLDRLL